MQIYLLVNIIIIFLAFLIYLAKKGKRTQCQKKVGLFVVVSFCVLFFISAFRGDFATDYNQYIRVFNFYSRLDIFETIKLVGINELGFKALNIFVAKISSSDIAIMIATTMIILVLFYIRLIKDSSNIWLSVLMFVSIGSYYTSFNMIRQMIAVSIVFAGTGFLYKNQTLKYILIVIFASSFHVSALVMIPLGLIMKNFKPSLGNLVILSPLLMLATLTISYFVSFFTKYFYTQYSLETAYGMEPISIKIVLVPLVFSLFAIVYSKTIDTEDQKNKIWLNAVYLYILFTLFSFSIRNFVRISEYFLPFLYLIVPLQISKINKLGRLLFLAIIPILLTLYVYISLKGGGYDPYYFR